MGKPKESLPWAGTTLLGHVVDQLLPCASPLVVLTRDPQQTLPPLATAAEIHCDTHPGTGPLGALHTGLERIASRCDAAFFTACDMPWVHPDVVAWLELQRGTAAGVMVRTGTQLHPLGAIYSTALRDPIARLLAQGVRTPRSLADRADIAIVEDLTHCPGGSRFLRGLNTPEEYERAVAEHQSPP